MSEPDADTYALKSATLAEVPAPALPYQPPMPRAYRPRIGVIGAGGIVSAHLDAYRTADGVSEKSGGWASSTGSVHQTVPMSAYPDTQSCCTSAPNRGVEAPADARVGFRVGSRCRTGEWGAPSGGCLGSRVGSLCRTREWKARPGGCLGSRVGSRCRTGEWGALPGGCLGSRVGADVVGGWW